MAIAIVGMEGIFPGAEDLAGFWSNLVARHDAAAPVDAARWGLSPDEVVAKGSTPDRAFSSRACLVRHEPALSIEGVDPSLLAGLDPTFTWALHAGQGAYRQGAMATLDPARVGVSLAAIALPTEGACALARDLVGAAYEAQQLGHHTPLRPLTPADRMNAQVVGLPGALLAQSLGLGGGSLTLDAACASSLYALKLACDALESGRVDAMLAGGVSRPSSLYTQIGFSQLQALSSSGRCAPFDASADGLVVGEGAAVFLLKRLPDAIAQGDQILGVIRGVGLSNDIRGGLLAPATEGQVRAMKSAYEQAGWEPNSVDLIECHGTGTRLGDQREAESLCELWEGAPWTPGQCAIGSVKSNIGHLLTAAAAAGTAKVLMAFQEATLPPTAHFQTSHETSPLPGSPFRVLQAAEPWSRRAPEQPRRAAVSAFGFGGINAHVLLEEWDSALPTSAQVGWREAGEPKALELPVVGITGMAARVGHAENCDALLEAVFSGEALFAARPAHRWHGTDDWVARHRGAGFGAKGAFIERLDIPVGRFPLPPNEIEQTLPQQLLMLQVAAAAMEDAGLSVQGSHPRVGAIIGIQFDLEATHFDLRWAMPQLAARWAKTLGLDLSEEALGEWVHVLRESLGPALNGPRTVGALGGIVASRVAKAFGLGGPCFVVSASENAGLCALELGAEALQKNELDAVLVGAVDLAGDVRQMLALDPGLPATVGEGASAMVLQRAAEANSVYALVKGIARVGGGLGLDVSACAGAAIEGAFAAAGCGPELVDLIEVAGADVAGLSDDVLGMLEAHYPGEVHSKALSATMSVAGNTHTQAGLLAALKVAACLHRRLLPPLPGYVEREGATPDSPLFMPDAAQVWLRNRCEGPRRGAVHSEGSDGQCVHLLLEEASDALRRAQPKTRPSTWGLFVLDGLDVAGLLTKAMQLQSELQTPSMSLAAHAHRWWSAQGKQGEQPLTMAIVATSLAQVLRQLDAAIGHLRSHPGVELTGQQGLYYTPAPLGGKGKMAFLYPGSGNHYVGMGRGIGQRWPEIFEAMDAETARLRSQWRPRQWVPRRDDWGPGWQADAAALINEDAHTPIFGQVVHGGMMTRVAESFGLSPDAAIGYSLGESAALFALGVWPERGAMLERMEASSLFQTQLSGVCDVARDVWNIPADQPVDWAPAVFACPASAVTSRLSATSTARLLIVNTPDECVVGGRRKDVNALQAAIGCEFFPLEGVVTVHCEVVAPVAKAYRDLHLFPTTPRPGLAIYSGYWGQSYDVTQDKAADSIVEQALHGFDYPAVIQQAYDDGVRLFVELGPRNSCSRMVRKILGDQPHFAQSICVQGEEDDLTVCKLLAALTVHGVPVDLAAWYGASKSDAPVAAHATPSVGVLLGGPAPDLLPQPTSPRPLFWAFEEHHVREPVPMAHDRNDGTHPSYLQPQTGVGATYADAPRNGAPVGTPVVSALAPSQPVSSNPYVGALLASAAQTARSHGTYLQVAAQGSQDLAAAYGVQAQLLSSMIGGSAFPQGLMPLVPRPEASSLALSMPVTNGASQPQSAAPVTAGTTQQPIPSTAQVAFDRDQCMAFAVGSLASVLGPDFAEVDSYPVRVRLPDEPLMLVDRILSVDATMGAMDQGSLITEHDVLPGAWYLDGDCAPVCVSVEAGQADLFLCSYLGIDLVVKGTRAYRLLDAEIHFHRGLPRVGEVIQYDITIDKFVRQGDVVLFFFRFDGTINGEPLLTMRKGCAGFFTPEEVEDSGGIIFTEAEQAPAPGVLQPGYAPLLPVDVASYSAQDIGHLRRGDVGACFGLPFDRLPLKRPATLPSGKLELLDRVLSLDPEGGRFGLGKITAEADIHPDDWFLTCHFVDDMVMPGTLMYECCAHTLRVLLMRMGWIGEAGEVVYEPVPGITSALRCRGPVTVDTKQVLYEVEIKEIGVSPYPYVIADALMSADGKRVVSFTDMSMQMTGADFGALQAMWAGVLASPFATPPSGVPQPALYDEAQIMAYAVGKPSEGFGAAYEIFDKDRVIARLPGPPYLFLDRIVGLEPAPWELRAGGWIEGEYAVPPDAWYFAANRQATMPFGVLLEIALQPCGWLAAYLGSALRCEEDVSFRNLGGEATLFEEILPDAGLLTTRVRMSSVAQAGGMIIEKFDLQLWREGRLIYEGRTEFGFFTKGALSTQVGIIGAEKRGLAAPDANAPGALVLPRQSPITPDAASAKDLHVDGPAMPGVALCMVDQIDACVLEGGPHGLGYVQGTKRIDPAEWFFKAHFYQDPVCPGSLGLESFLQLLKHYAIQRWGDVYASTHRFGPTLLGKPHKWIYRGQILPTATKAEVEAVITEVGDGPAPFVKANGFLKVDGLYIYEMVDMGISLVPKEGEE